MEELKEISFPYQNSDAKNLFICDDKKQNYYLIVVKGDKKVNLKEFKQKYNTRSLSFASEKELLDILGLVPGFVSPFGILNDNERKVTVYIDYTLTLDEGIVGVHPNDNTATAWLKTIDLISIIKEHGNIVNIVEI